jgi:hypothetical protein
MTYEEACRKNAKMLDERLNARIADCKRIIEINQPYASEMPETLPKAWSEMSEAEKGITLFYIHRMTSFDRSRIARHLIGKMIIEATEQTSDWVSRMCWIENQTEEIWALIMGDKA